MQQNGTRADTAQPSSLYHDTNDESHDPLIAHQRDTSAIDHDTDADSLLHNEETDHIQPVPSSNRRQIYLLTLIAGLSGLLFGYDTGIISSTLINLHLSLGRPLSITHESLITSSTSLLALLASPFAGLVADSLGRKPLIAATCVLFTAGALVQAFAGAVWVMVLGRGIVGLAIGAASGVVPVYIGEIAPARSRGRLVTVQALLITGGQVVAYCVGAAVMGRWRIAVGVGALPALLQAVLLLGMPESPRWLFLKRREDQARRVLARLGEDVEGVLGRIKEEVKEEEISRSKSVWSEIFLVPGHRRALTIACMLQGLQQLCGFVSRLSAYIMNQKLTMTERPHVLFRHHLHPRRLHHSHNHIAIHRHHQLHLYALRVQPYRQHWPPSDLAPLHTIHGTRTCPLSCLLLASTQRLGRVACHTIPCNPEAQPHPLCATIKSDTLRRSVCTRSGLRAVAARRAISFVSEKSGQWAGHCDELGR